MKPVPEWQYNLPAKARTDPGRAAWMAQIVISHKALRV